MHPQAKNLPPKPEPPKDYDCCGGGCADCELRRYYQALAEWQRLAASVSTLQDSAAPNKA